MALEAAGAGIIGGLLGGAGGIFSSISAKKQQKKFKKGQKEGIQAARVFADERIEQLLGKGSLFSLGEDFLRGTFENAADSPLAQDFVKGIRQAQASRGTLAGPASEFTEAGGLAAFSQQLKAGLLPQLQSFSLAPEQLRQSIVGFEAPLRVASRTGASIAGITPPQILPSIFGSALSGAAGGFLGGAQIGAAQDTALREQQFLDDFRTSQGLNKFGQPISNRANELIAPTFQGATSFLSRLGGG